MTTTRWWWIRHAPVTSRKGWCYGQEDWPADCSDVPAFAVLAQLLPRDAIWVTSNLQRTHQTAAAIFAAGYPEMLPMLVEPELAEQSFGDWQGRRHDELRNAPDSVYTTFWLAPARHRPPGGESFVELIERVERTIERLNRSHRGRDIVAVTHGGTIRAALAVALRIDPEHALSFAIDNLSITRLDHFPEASGDSGGRGLWRIAQVNQAPR
ncbi:MAG: histidine phosphatase family protein [Alphaproteobacteria bacterium]|nr:histidine phosphatase family protein [Alphaproteobacteria bacterium]